MDIIFVLIPLGLLLLVAAVGAFFWATRNGQFDDLETPAWRILLDDDRRPPRAAEETPDNKAPRGGRPDDQA